MRLRRRAAIPGFVVWFTLASSARAEDSPASVVWYRASEECPSGAEFLGKLAGTPPRARLADAGDHIDFVVTLVATRGATVGRLERQTQSGTVAIRELRDVSCARVADALALSLGLAIGPAPPATVATAALEGPAPNAESTVPGAAGSAPAAFEEPDPVAPAPATRRPLPTPSAPPEGPAPSSEGVPARGGPGWSAGLDGGVLVGVAPSALPRVAAFVDADHVLSGAASDLSLRFAVVGALGLPMTDVGQVEHWILAGRAEVCPWHWGSARFGFRPCAAFELGATGASESSDTRQSRQRASSVWAAPGLGLRAAAQLWARLAFELGADALVPLSRSEVTAGTTRLYRTNYANLSGYLGLCVGPF